MKNPIVKVCDIIESYRTPEQLTVARRFVALAEKRYPGASAHFQVYLKYAQAEIDLGHFIGVFEDAKHS